MRNSLKLADSIGCCDPPPHCMPQAAALAGQENPAMLERFSSDLYRPGFLAGRAHPNQATELRASRSFARKVPIGGGHFPRGAAVGTQSQAPL